MQLVVYMLPLFDNNNQRFALPFFVCFSDELFECLRNMFNTTMGRTYFL